MKLSLYILEDWLEKYHPVCSISEGNRSIRNVRIFSDELEITPNNVYVGRTGGDSGNVICMHENDYIILDSSDENQILNEIMDAFDFYNGWSDRIGAALGELSLTEILDMSGNVLKGTLMVADATYFVHACSSDLHNSTEPIFQDMLMNHMMDISYIMNVEKDSQIRQRKERCYIQRTGNLPSEACVRNLHTNNRHWGWLVSAAAVHTRGQMDIQEELGSLLESWMSRHSDFQMGLEQSGVFLSILDGSYHSKDTIGLQLQLFHWRVEDLTFVYVFYPEETARVLFRLIDRLNKNVHMLFYEGRLAAILHGNDKDRLQFENQLEKILIQTSCTCGVSPSFSDIFDLKEYYRLACAAGEHSDRPIQHFSDITLDFAMDILQDQCRKWLIHPAIYRLKEYDRRNHTDFYHTFEVYLQCERNYARTAAALHIHRNTLLYRVERISDLIETDLDDWEVRLHLILSMKLHSDE